MNFTGTSYREVTDSIPALYPGTYVKCSITFLKKNASEIPEK
jgi:hypothetical protein